MLNGATIAARLILVRRLATQRLVTIFALTFQVLATTFAPVAMAHVARSGAQPAAPSECALHAGTNPAEMSTMSAVAEEHSMAGMQHPQSAAISAATPSDSTTTAPANPLSGDGCCGSHHCTCANLHSPLLGAAPPQFFVRTRIWTAAPVLRVVAPDSRIEVLFRPPI